MEDTTCHSKIFSIFLNVSLPLVFCTGQKTILANKQRKMKEGSMSDERLKMVLANSTSAVMRITVHYLHFAFIPMEIEII